MSGETHLGQLDGIGPSGIASQSLAVSIAGKAACPGGAGCCAYAGAGRPSAEAAVKPSSRRVFQSLMPDVHPWSAKESLPSDSSPGMAEASNSPIT